ncbi:MAG: galactose-1-phosphate uridylyltransferase [Bacteroidota bacterium]|nr:galactose-1-phosphate uridylyltransferase [Bacteroidota bacterium]
MPEFRQNFATKEWVIIAPERKKRPQHFPHCEEPPCESVSYRPDCPFCPGKETETGRETLRYEEDGAWTLRVVQNKYSALDPTRSVVRRKKGIFLCSDNYGDAEVVIESPLHNETIPTLDHARVVDIFRAYRQRSIVIGMMPHISIIMIFRNFGPTAGTSIEHPHSQIIASPIIPPHIRDPFQKAALHYDSHGTCVYCDLLEEERGQNERIVYENEHFVVFCPFASRSPYEIRIYPKRHTASYSLILDDEIDAFAEAVRLVLRKVRDLLGDPSYNYIIRSSPIGDEDVRYLHWYFVLIPKITTPAGFEIGSGIYINPSSPEECAAQLREA